MHRVVIVVEGGLVRTIASNVKGIEFRIVDLDVNGIPDEELNWVPDLDGGSDIPCAFDNEQLCNTLYEPDYVKDVFAAFAERARAQT